MSNFIFFALGFRSSKFRMDQSLLERSKKEFKEEEMKKFN